MKLRLTCSGASAAFCAAAIARLYSGLTLECPRLHNGAWLSALLGGALAAPVVCALTRNRARVRTARALLAVFALMDAASTAHTLALSASFLAFDRAPTSLLAVPVCLVALRCLFLNGAAIGASARIWLKALPLLLVVLLAAQFSRFEPDWLFPILGEGWDGILDGAVRAAGWLALLSALWLCVEPSREGPPPLPLRGLTFAALISAVLLAAHLMMTPTLRQNMPSLAYLLDALLTNGRAPLALQLPMAVGWFIALLNLLALEAFLAAALIQAFLPKTDGRVAAVAVVAAVMLMNALGLPGRAHSGSLARLALLAASIAAAISFIPSRGGKRPCAS